MNEQAIAIKIGGKSSKQFNLDIDSINDIIFLIVIASTKTSTIPGISIAGKTPEYTLYTPALDVEYLLTGKPITIDAVPITPQGIPTPALISRSLMELLKITTIVVDAGSYIDPKIPHIDLPSRTVGEPIRSGKALPEGTSKKLYEEGFVLGRSVGGNRVVFIGESMPGGTTTALSILEALGFRARGRVSSAGPENPHDLKWSIVSEGFANSNIKPPVNNVFKVNDLVGDPLHISIAGIAHGIIESGGRVVLAGGTQMCSVIAILNKLNLDYKGKITIATTSWLYNDRSSNIEGLISDIDREVPIYYTDFSFNNSPYKGLRSYDEGYVKEGVGIGGYLLISSLLEVPRRDVEEAIYREYSKLISLKAVES